MKDSIICPKPNCGCTVYWHQDRCSKCGQDVGFPNIREVSCREEQETLQHRYEKALDDAKNRDAEHRVQAFEAAVESQSHAVINVWPAFLSNFLTREIPYKSYNVLADAGIRHPVSIDDDSERRTIGSAFFGLYAKEIAYAALSLNGSGLISYGHCAFTIADITAGARATVLEENSYTFRHHHSVYSHKDIPFGYRAVWHDRHKLAIAKLADQISKITPESSFPGLLLFSDGDRKNDKFMEIHLYGSFDNQAVEAVKIPKPETANDHDRPDLERIRDWARSNGKG